MMYTPIWFQRYRANGTVMVHLRFEDGKRAVCGEIVPEIHTKPEPFDQVCIKCKRDYFEGLKTCWSPIHPATLAK